MFNQLSLIDLSDVV